ncbi:MAG TPA: PAS domain S-box protein [Chthoniobacter sp.]|nr:PAS domain S-box protein [Chthoniobacter sp.]
MDTLPEEALDDLTALAASICEAPIALISLVDEQRQWFKSKVGLTAAETPREVSFCAHALRQPGLFIVPDATADERFLENPLVTGEPGIRFYAGAPLISPEGDALGTLCVIDRVPRTLTAPQELALRVLARQVMTHLKLTRQWRELQASEGKLRAIFEAEPECVKLLGPDATFFEMNAAGLQLIEADNLETVAGQSLLPLVVPEDRDAVVAMLEAVAGGERRAVQYRIIGLKGTPRWVEMKGAPFRDAETGQNLVLGVSHDITERRRSDERFRWLVDSNAQGVMYWNTKGEITGANDAFLNLAGYSRSELQAGQLDWVAMTPDEYAEPDRRAREEIGIKGVCVPYEKEFIRKDGSRVPILLSSAIFEDNADEGVCFILDLTESKKLEQHALRAQRMESIGTLAGGIAHDLNNSLGPIIMSLDLLKMKFTDPSSQELISIISSSAHRGADMVRQLLSFARGVESRRMDVQVKHLIGEVEKISYDTFPKNIQIRTIVPHDLWTVLGDPTQLHQVLLNLCVNARDAMPRGGTLTLTAENLTFDTHYAGLSWNLEAKAGPYVCIQVADTGTGMPAKVIEKIFDPFFTTKELGKGTGLGLSTSLAILKSHGGFIRVYSELGKGTKFSVYLPAQTEFSPAEAAKLAAEMPRGHGELILVVDDELAVRQITEQTLQAFGYRVVLATDGAEATAIYARHGAEIDLVITDMMMPNMDGAATVQVLRKMNPAVRIIGTSGLSVESHGSQAASLGLRDFLPKPYTAETLLKMLKNALSTDPPEVTPITSPVVKP